MLALRKTMAITFLTGGFVLVAVTEPLQLAFGDSGWDKPGEGHGRTLTAEESTVGITSVDECDGVTCQQCPDDCVPATIAPGACCAPCDHCFDDTTPGPVYESPVDTAKCDGIQCKRCPEDCIAATWAPGACCAPCDHCFDDDDDQSDGTYESFVDLPKCQGMQCKRCPDDCVPATYAPDSCCAPCDHCFDDDDDDDDDDEKTLDDSGSNGVLVALGVLAVLH